MSESKNIKSALIVISLFLPIIPFLFAARNIWNKRYHFAVLIFSFWFGYSVFLYSGDILEYEKSFPIVANYTWRDFFSILSDTYSDDKFNVYEENVVISKPDMYALCMQFFVSRVTNESRAFFALVSLIYTYFFLKFIQEVILATGTSKSKMFKIFGVFLLFIVPFYVGVTGIRFWTALFLYMLFTMRYLRTGSLKSLMLTGLSILIHYTFMFPVLVLLTYQFLKLSKTFSRVLVVASIFYFLLASTTGVLGFIEQSLSIFNETSISETASSYTNSEVLNQRLNSTGEANWYVLLRSTLITYSFIVIFILEYFKIIQFRKFSFIERITPLQVIFFCIAMFTINLGSLARFNYIFQMLTIIKMMYIVVREPNNRRLKILSNTLIPVIALHILVSLRAGFYYVDPLLVIGNPIVFLTTQSSISLSEFLVGH